MPPDAVIFDVDGVLVDVRGSFLDAVKRAVQRTVVAETRALDDAPLVDDSVIATFKRAGGFNNDWDLAHALALWYLETAGDARTTSEIRERAGEVAAAARVSLDARAARVPRPTHGEMRSLMLELYWGSAEAERLFGVKPRLDVREPLLASERVLLRPETVIALRLVGVRRFGVLTGRLRVEYEAIRHRLPLPADAPALTDEDGRKPDPMFLRRLVDRLEAKRPCYVGDVMDDWGLVAAYNARFPSAPAVGVLVASDGADERAFRAAGATLILRDVNDLPELLAR